MLPAINAKSCKHFICFFPMRFARTMQRRRDGLWKHEIAGMHPPVSIYSKIGRKTEGGFPFAKVAPVINLQHATLL